MSKKKPIRIFWSELSQRFYASQAYREESPGVVVITGDKYDVTDQIAGFIERHQIEFRRKEPPRG